MRRFAQCLCIGIGLALPASGLAAQTTLENPVGQKQDFHLDSGVKANARAESSVVFEETIRLEDVAWIRLYFGDVQLEGNSYIKVTSRLDGEVQMLDLDTVRMWNYSTAYFNGDAVDVELVADANTSNRLIIADIAFQAGSANDRGSCGICDPDERAPSFMNHSCRLMPVGCSATVYHEDSCMVTAGHCVGDSDVAQFNVPPSNADCSLNNPPVADQFPVNVFAFANGGVGNDWGVLTSGTNNLNQKPFDRYGMLIPIGAAVPNGTLLDNWGYGVDNQCVRTQVQQFHRGPVNQVNASWYRFALDITFGNSGSNVTANGGIVGVVSHCNTSCSPQQNVATRTDFPPFAAAIAAACEDGGGEEKCKGDGNGDGVVDVNDLLGLLAAWGPCNSGSECEVGFVCGGEIVFCGSQGQCICFTGFDGSPVCAFDDSCSNPQCFNGDQDCPTGMVCVIDTCCVEPTCIPNCEGMGPGNAPEIKPDQLSAANSLEFLSDSPIGNGYIEVDFGNPDCPYDFNGDGFVDVNDLLSLLANWGPCPTGELCEVGFVCGGDIVICGEFKGFQCICFTHFSGQPVCAASSSCSNPPCPNGQGDCPDGFLCIIDTCCADNVCLEDCGGNQMEDCEVGFTCGDQITPCPVDPENCVCVTNWDGTPDCVDISGGGGCDLFVTCNNGPSECPAGTSCIINTCCADAICIPTCEGGGGGSDCEVGFTCGDTLTPCPEGGPDCFCWTYFDGSFQCAQNGFCDTLCPNGQSDCPPGTLCMIDTCCTDPVCLPECGGGQSECEVGFVCGGDIVTCGSQGQCFCFTGFDGNPVCAFDGSCGNPSCFGGDADCPSGMVCVIDTCCGDPVCIDNCEGLNPGNGPEIKPGEDTASGGATTERLRAGGV